MSIKARPLAAWSTWCALLCAAVCAPASGAVKLKDLARVDGSQDVMILGYGLVVGLSGTGDSARSVATTMRRILALVPTLPPEGEKIIEFMPMT